MVCYLQRNLRSYRTYEEWKPNIKRTQKLPPSYCSYRTYEEWKHRLQMDFLTIAISSYRTYEEWKHFVCLVP